MLYTRRDILSSSAAFLISPRLEASQPWEYRKPAEWTPDDIQSILDRSAWARPATMEVSSDALDPNHGKGKKRVAAATGLPDKRIFPDYQILVRWESGLPMRLARHDGSPLAADPVRYLLSMSRLPLFLLATLSNEKYDSSGDQDSIVKARVAEQVAKSAVLQCQDKKPLHADHTEWAQTDFESRLLISFPHANQPIELSDGAVAFVSQVNEMIIRTSFLLSRMRYRGNLEL